MTTTAVTFTLTIPLPDDDTTVEEAIRQAHPIMWPLHVSHNVGDATVDVTYRETVRIHGEPDSPPISLADKITGAIRFIYGDYCDHITSLTPTPETAGA